MPRLRRTKARGRGHRYGKRPRTAVLLGLAIFLIALVLRVIYVLQARANPQFDAPIIDPGFHDEWAWQMATGTREHSGPFFRAPLYPLFLAAVYAIGGHNFLLPRLLQAILGSASCVLIYLIGARLFSRATGFAAGLGGALYWIFIYFDNELLIPVLFVFLTLSFFYTLIRALEDRPAASTAAQGIGSQSSLASIMWLSAASGAFYGLAAIARPNIMIFLPALAWAFYRGVKRSFPPRGVTAFALAALIPIGAVTAHNVIAGGDFVIVASQGGVNFYIGNNEQSDGRSAIVPGTRPDWWGGRRFDTIRIAEREEGRSLKDSEVSAYWFREGLRFIAGHPWQWLKLTVRKFALFWSAPEIGNNSSINYLRSYAPIMRLPFLGFGLIAPLAIAGIYLALRRRRKEMILPLLFIILYMTGVVAFFVCARYRVPVIPFLLIFAGYAVTESVALFKKGERAKLLPALGVLALVAYAVNVKALSLPENIALAKFRDGVAWRQKGRVAEAERAFRDALRLNPGLTAARGNLANLIAERGDTDVAIRAYENLIAADPGNVKALSSLASIQVDSGNLAAAESTVTRALEIDPNLSDPLRVLGVIRERRGDLSGARELYTRAMEFTRDRHRLENKLGVLSMKEKRFQEAEEHLRRAVEMRPSYAIAWHNLGALLTNTGRAEEAVEALERSASLRPHSRDAWSQLAKVLNHLGRTAEAQKALRRAAAIPAESKNPVP